jgi:predicted Rossmann fold nucleotide-binding protein DprA/Smf involved in DNA uptake
MPQEISSIHVTDTDFPVTLREYLGTRRPDSFFFIGDLGIISRPKLALFCSTRCPGELILRSFDTARELRDAGIAVMSGFHSPVERECFRILLRGRQPVILWLSRSLQSMRIPHWFEKPLDEGRLLILSGCAGRPHRTTAASAAFRNALVAASADQILVIHAAPSSRTEQLCIRIATWCKPYFVLPSIENASQLEAGAIPFKMESVKEKLYAARI